MQLGLIGVLAIVAYLVVSPMLSSDPAPASSIKAAPKSSTKKADDYLPEDYKAKPADFVTVAVPLRNAFNPIIKAPEKGGKGGVSTVNVVPPEYAGGEANWVYTGSARIDGAVEALLQNNTSGDNVFLKVGDTWKGVSVEEITDDSLVLASPELGETKKLELPPDVVTGPTSGPGGFAPQSPLRGNIGPMAIQPDPNAGTAAAQDPTAATGGLPDNGALPGGYTGGFSGGRRGGGRRGGRGRGGFGGAGG